MKKQFLILPLIAFIGIGATTYTITQLTSNTSPSNGTVIEVYDPSATPKSGKYLLTNLISATKTTQQGMSGPLGINNGTVVSSEPVLDLIQTWNNAGVDFTSVSLNVTNTASGASSKLLNLMVSGSSKMNLASDGVLTVPFSIKSGYLTFDSNLIGSSDSSKIYLGLNNDVVIHRDAANTPALRNGTSAQEFRLYNTWSNSGTDYERLYVKFSGNVAQIGVEAGGTGVIRPLQVMMGTNVLSFSGTNLTFNGGTVQVTYP